MELIWYIPHKSNKMKITRLSSMFESEVFCWCSNPKKIRKNLFEIPNMCKSFILLNHGFSQWLSPVKPLEITASCARFSPATLCARLGFCGPRPGLGPGWCRPPPCRSCGAWWAMEGWGTWGGWGRRSGEEIKHSRYRPYYIEHMIMYLYIYICTYVHNYINYIHICIIVYLSSDVRMIGHVPRSSWTASWMDIGISWGHFVNII